MSQQKQTNNDADTVSFGFRDVRPNEKTEMVSEVFASVAGKYDLMNDLMSLGIHRLWKGAMLDWLNPRPDQTLVDVGGGTGDITFKWLARGGGPVQVVDYSAEMIGVGRDRAIDKGILDGITWTVGNAEELPLDDSSVDVYASAFCLRNVARLDKALAEARRVLKPGGRFMCLEFSHLIVPALEDAYDAWSFKVLPALGERVAADRESYVYLAESIRRFPDQDTYADMIRDAGLEQVKVRNLSAGIAALHSAWRL
ncbi:MAG: class I SAM-dependent methyltransferase [Rhodospirillales bacterium]|nr:class I SAM-dependent methyltransferase [Rhodospirillales bacterium]MBO6788533.1 class I SAM-dependent methyltransferase [Rhodospirillales bacterium]